MSKIDYQKLREIAEKTKIAGEAPVMPFDQRINALNDFMKHFSPDIALALLDERERNQQYIKSRDQENEGIALTVGKLRVELEAAEKRIAELESLMVPQLPQQAVPDEIPEPDTARMFFTDAVVAIAKVQGWNACRAAMLQSGNFRENKNSSTNNFREIAETSTNYPVIPSEVLSAIREVAKIRADFDDFDGDRRGIGDCLDEVEQELIVTINKYASQLAAEPIAPNDVREQTAIPQVPVTQDGWISCSEQMPAQDDWILIYSKHGEYMAGQVQGEYVELSDGTLSWLGNALFWMPLPEPPQEAK